MPNEQQAFLVNRLGDV